MKNTKEIIGAVTEHWMTKRLRQHQPINDPSNVIRISAKSILLLHNEKMKQLGTSRSLHEESLIQDEVIKDIE